MTELKRRLYRSRSNRMVAGVVAGLSDYFGIDPTLGRVIFVTASFLSAAFPGLIVYAILWAIVPEGPI